MVRRNLSARCRLVEVESFAVRTVLEGSHSQSGHFLAASEVDRGRRSRCCCCCYLRVAHALVDAGAWDCSLTWTCRACFWTIWNAFHKSLSLLCQSVPRTDSLGCGGTHLGTNFQFPSTCSGNCEQPLENSRTQSCWLVVSRQEVLYGRVYVVGNSSRRLK